jgi:hypothetical protein
MGFFDIYDDISIIEDNYEIALEEMRTSQNFYWLVDGVIAGMAQPQKNNRTIQNLKILGIGTVISLNGFEWEELEKSGIKHISYKLPDPIKTPSPLTEGYKVSIEPIKNTLKEMITTTSEIFSEKQGRPVVIHCELGISRTGSLLGAWLQIHSEEQANEIIKIPYKQISTSIEKIKKCCNPGLFSILKKDRDLLNELLRLRDPKVVAATKTQFSDSDQAKNIKKKGCKQNPIPANLAGNKRLPYSVSEEENDSNHTRFFRRIPETENQVLNYKGFLRSKLRKKTISYSPKKSFWSWNYFKKCFRKKQGRVVVIDQD